MGIRKVPLLHVLILALSALPLFAGPAPSERVVPPIDPELLTGPEMAARQAEKDRKASELRQRKTEFEAEMAKAKQSGRDTERFESAIAEITSEIRAIYRPPADDPIHRYWPELRAKTAEIRKITQGEQPITVIDANHIIDMLYVNVEPRLNCNLQHATFLGIKEASEGKRLSEEANRVLRDRLLEYYYVTKDGCNSANKGPTCDPYGTSFFATAISVVANPDDDEAIACVEDLKERVSRKCEELQWGRDKGLCERMLREAEDRLSPVDQSPSPIADVEPDGMSQFQIAKLLRAYGRLLREQRERVAPQSLRTIDQNLLKLAHVDMTTRNWELWGRVTIEIGPKRASKGLKDYLAQQSSERSSTRTGPPQSVFRAYGVQRAQRVP